MDELFLNYLKLEILMANLVFQVQASSFQQIARQTIEKRWRGQYKISDSFLPGGIIGMLHTELQTK